MGQAWSREAALVEILRGRLEGLGPVSPVALAAPLGLEANEIDAALVALQTEGFAMRGRFTAGANTEEWCDRRLLARIHNYTVKRLRAEIEPVAARDFLRFLFAWQHVTADEQREGPEALAATVKQLEGFEAPAGAWESEILAARVTDYEPAWLDDECLAGRVAWARLQAAQRNRCEWRRARSGPGARDADHAARAAQRAALARAVGPCRGGRSRGRARRRSPTSSGIMARRSSTNWSRASGCCAPRSRRRWPNWCRSAWRPRTVSSDCARCWFPPNCAN